MKLRTIFLLLILCAIGAFSLLNWNAFITPTTVSLGLAEVQAPLGAIMLGMVVFLTAFFLVFVVYMQASAIGLLSKLSITSFAVLIPLSFILFRSVSLTKVLVLSLALASPFIYLSNISELVSRLVFIIAIVGVSPLFWLIKNSHLNIHKLNQVLYALPSKIKANFADFDTTFDTKRCKKVQHHTFLFPFLITLCIVFLSYFLGAVILLKLALISMLIFWLISMLGMESSHATIYHRNRLFASTSKWTSCCYFLRFAFGHAIST